MPQVVDQSGAVVDMAPEHVADAWRSGQVQLVGGANYHVKMPTGQFYSVPAESLHTALGNGGTVVSEADVAAHHEAEEYGGVKGAAIAFGGGALEQGTFGLGTELLPASAKAAVAASERQHPLVYGAGELGGAVGLSLVLPGGGIGGLLERGGAAALEGAGASTMERLAARATIGAAKATAEGAQFGAAQAISDNAIADHKLTASQMLATVGANALWGGAIGAGFGAIGGALARGAEAAHPGAAAEATTKLDQALAKGASEAEVESAAAKAIGAPEAAPGLGAKVKQWYAKISAAASGGDEKTIAKFVGEDGYANRKALLEADATREEASRAIRGHVDEILQASRAIQEEGQGGLKRGYIRKAVADVDPAQASQSARDMTDKAISTLDEMVKKPEDYGGAAPLKRAMTVAKTISAKLDTAIEKGDVAEQFGLVDDLKKAIGKYTKGASRLSPMAATDELVSLQNRARAAGLQELYEGLRTGLENEDVWKKAATDQKAINQAWTTQIDASNRFHSALTTEVGRDPNNPWMNVRGVDPAKADSYVKNLTNPAQDLTHKAVTDYVTSSKNLAETMAEAYEMPAAKLAEVKRVSDAASAFGSTLDKTTQSLQLANQFEQLRNAASGHGTAWAALAGAASHGVAGGIEGMALGKVAGLFTRPADAIMKVARIEQMARDSDNRIVQAFRGFARGKGKPSTYTPMEAYGRKAAQVKALSASPELLQERLAANTNDLRGHAPKLAGALTMTTLAGLAFLRDKLPPSLPIDPLDPNRKQPPPPANARAQWLRYYDAVKDPISVVDDLRAGRVSPEGIEVVKTVYSPLYQRMQELAMQELSAGKMKELGTQQRMGLGLLLDLPLPELQPAYIQARQAAYAAAEQEHQQKQAAGEKPGAKRRPIDLTKKAAPPALTADRIAEGAGT